MASLPPDIQESLEYARMRLINRFPFFGHLALYLKTHIDNETCPTMSVDNRGNLYINEKFARQLSSEGWIFVLAHEVMHLATLSHVRFPPGGIWPLFNIASDLAINHMLAESRLPFPEVPMKPVYGGQFEKYKNWPTEAIYYDLLKNYPDINKLMSEIAKNGEWSDDSAERCNGGGKGEASEEEKTIWKQRVAGARVVAKSAGNMPGALEDFINNLLNPKRDWRKEVRMYASYALRGKWTWRRKGRRTGDVVRTPGRDREPPIAAVYVDTSGSMSDEERLRSLSEGAEIIRLCGGKGRLLLGDCQIYYDGEVTPDSMRKLPLQRGGTDFRVVFEAIEGWQRNPDLLIGFSDMEGPFPEVAPDFPVIWCKPTWADRAPTSSIAPWGKNVEIEI
jgi:predicted metal-dependent peptidase